MKLMEIKNPNARSDTKDPYIHYDLRNARVTAGYTMSVLAEQVGVSIPTIHSYERLRAMPNPLVARKIARILGKRPDELFPPQLKGIIAEIEEERRGYNGPEAISLEEIGEDEIASSQENPANITTENMLRDRIEDVLKVLTYRDREIIKLKYGIGDGCNYTLEEISRIFSVTRARVRQVEAKAISRLQHPVRARKLEGFLG